MGNEKVKTFRDLKVWQKSHSLVLEIYKLTEDLPVEEKYGLASQIKRSAVSIPSNIVEGFKRKSKKEFFYFLTIADSSLEETKYHLLLAKDLGFLRQNNIERIETLCDEIGKMLYGLKSSLNRKGFST